MIRLVKCAIIHDWLTGMRGGENCLEAFLEIFPQADLFTLIHVPGSVSARIERQRITTSLLQRLPGAPRRYRHLLPLMPLAIEQFDLSPYDLVLSSSHCVAKGVLPRPDALHISYVHTPMRYAWDLWPEYFPAGGKIPRWLVAPLLNYLRTWDVVSSTRVDRYVANSSFVAQRIAKFYRRTATVVPPPVDCAAFDVERREAEHYLVVNALVPYKRIELAVRACGELGRRLVVVGEGPLLRSLSASAPACVSFRGRVDGDALAELYASAHALIMPAVEDFGIAPLEANAAGTPVIAFGRGGALDSVVPVGSTGGAPRQDGGPTGLLYDDGSVAGLKRAILDFEDCRDRFDPAVLRRHARRFDRDVFIERMRTLIDETIRTWNNGAAAHTTEPTPLLGG